MISQSLMDLWYGFGVAFQWHNLMWSFFGVLVGNLIGVLPAWAPCRRSRSCCRSPM